jgi:hypothetical protein
LSQQSFVLEETACSLEQTASETDGTHTHSMSNPAAWWTDLELENSQSKRNCFCERRFDESQFVVVGGNRHALLLRFIASCSFFWADTLTTFELFSFFCLF